MSPTWVVNKISRTILKAAFVSIAFVVTGKFVVSAFALLLLTFMTASTCRKKRRSRRSPACSPRFASFATKTSSRTPWAVR